MYLGIEIGGTKLQLGVGPGDGSPLVAIERYDVDPRQHAAGILEQIERHAPPLIARHGIEKVGVGFGGPVDVVAGRVIKSHHVEGWDGFALAEWCRTKLLLPAVVGNDCDVAALAEAHFGAGRGQRVVFYITVGSGIGGGLVIDGQSYLGAGSPVAEIGHLRPGLLADRPEETVESLASGWSIAAEAQNRLAEPVSHQFKALQSGVRSLDPEHVRQRLIEVEESTEEYAADLRERCNGELDRLTAKVVAQAAADGNEVAREILSDAITALGWGVAQMITLMGPQVVVIGGGVSLIGETLFFAPLREVVQRYVFPPLVDRYRIVPAELCEAVVVHGALAIAADSDSQTRRTS